MCRAFEVCRNVIYMYQWRTVIGLLGFHWWTLTFSTYIMEWAIPYRSFNEIDMDSDINLFIYIPYLEAFNIVDFVASILTLIYRVESYVFRHILASGYFRLFVLNSWQKLACHQVEVPLPILDIKTHFLWEQFPIFLEWGTCRCLTIHSCLSEWEHLGMQTFIRRRLHQDGLCNFHAQTGWPWFLFYNNNRWFQKSHRGHISANL